MARITEHSVTLFKSKCKGCTTCIKQCPTQAIRVQNGKAKILKERCIDCGECIRVCPYKAKQAVTDNFSILNNFKYNIALPAPAFYGQFSKADSINVILNGLKKIGFDDVFEVARGAQIVSQITRKLMCEGKLAIPAISSACPAVVRLIAVRFPNLIDHIAPIKAPVEVAAKLAKEEAMAKTGLKEEEIGVIFISPCPAKATSIKSPIGMNKSYIDGAISIKDTYLKMAHTISKVEITEELTIADREGVLWATSGGEAQAIHNEKHIAVDGIHNVVKVLEEMEDEKIGDIEYVEALSCIGGCVGGPLTVENNFVARTKVKRLAKLLDDEFDLPQPGFDLFWEKPVVYKDVMNLDNDVRIAMRKMQSMDEIFERLPQLDCGSCGSPTCMALAEDIVRGYAHETDCIFRMRERVRELAREMMTLEGELPPAFMKEEDDDMGK